MPKTPRDACASVLALVGLLGVIGVVTSAVTPLPNRLTRWLAVPAKLEPAEAIVVLGAAVYPDGVLQSSALRRTVHGIVLYRRRLAPRLVFTGSQGATAGVEPRAALALALGVPREAVAVEARARTTIEEALAVRALLGHRRARILLVTDAQHMGRARAAFERAGLEVLAAPVEDVSTDATSVSDRLGLMHWVVRELVGRMLYRLIGIS